MKERHLKALRTNQEKATSVAKRPFQNAWLFAILVSLTALAFSPVLAAGYIGLDDPTHILENPGLRKLSGGGLLGFWTAPYFSLYIPVTYSLWWLAALVAHLFGTLSQTAWLFHALNLSLHLANSCLVFLLLRMLLLLRTQGSALRGARASCVAMLAALFFALHPVQVETVAWISECKGALSMSFELLGIWSYYRRSPKYMTVVCFVLAMLSKPTVIVAPGILLLVDRILLGRPLKESALVPLLLWLLLLPLVLITKHLQPDLDMDFVPVFSQRLYVAMDALGFYASTLVAPVALALDYGRSPEYVLAHVGGWRLALSLLVLLAAFAIPGEAIVRARPRSVWYSFVACGWSVFVLSLAPVLGLVPFKFQVFSTVADHYLYGPLLGAALMLTGILTCFRADGKALGIMVAPLLLLAGLSFKQATRWISTETLFAHTFEINPRSFLGYHSLATDLFTRGRWDDGIAQALKAVAIKPDYLPAQLSIGFAWIRKGELETAIKYYDSVLVKSSGSVGKHGHLLAAIHNNMGLALEMVGRRAEGMVHFRRAMELAPKSFEGYRNLAHAALEEGQYIEAILQYERALDLSPGNHGIEEQLTRARRGARKLLFERGR
jgi:tetratricopeptide (TPR) repeat protein